MLSLLRSCAAQFPQCVRLHLGISFSALFVGCVSDALPAIAATAPAPPPAVEPGAILQNQLQNQQNNNPGPPPGPKESPPVLEVTPPAPMELPAAPGVTFPLSGVTIDPSSFLTPQELATIYQPYVGKEVALSDLQNITDQINALYRAKGVATALAVLPPQRIENGVVHIQLVEGRVGNITIEGANLTNPAYITRRLGTTAGEVVNTDALAQALIRFNRTNQTQLQASLQPGASLGLTDVLLRASDPQPYEVQAFADNLGVKSVGRYEGGIFYRANEPLHIGDRLDLYIVGSAGTVTGNALYSIPFLSGQFEFSYARGLIDISNPPQSSSSETSTSQASANSSSSGNSVQSSDITGHSSTIAVNFTEPVFVNQEWLVDGVAYYARDSSTSALTGSPLTDNFTSKPAIGTRIEEITPTRYLLLTQTVAYERSHGVPNLSWALVANGTLTAVQQLPQPLAPFSLDFKGGWQVSDHSPLAPSELLQIGGFGSVRGYQQAALTGTSGYYLQSELHHPLISGLDGYGFFDVGEVFGGSAGALLAKGTGLGAAWNGQFLTLSAAAGYGFDQKRVAPQDTPYQFYVRLALHTAYSH